MPTARKCTECGNTLAGRAPQAKTCSAKCRVDRSRRIRQATKALEIAEPTVDPYKAMRAAIEREAPGSIAVALTNELKPVVREAITEDVLRAIRDLVNLTPTAVARLTEDMDSEDALVRQRAYTLALKYTVGHPAMVQPKDTAPNQQIVVNFGLPRPDEQPAIDAASEDIPDTTRVCDVCHEEKTIEEFASGSNRCQPCFTTARDKILSQYVD